MRSAKVLGQSPASLITATTSIHLPNPVSTDLTIKSDSVLTNPKGKGELQGWLV